VEYKESKERVSSSPYQVAIKFMPCTYVEGIKYISENGRSKMFDKEGFTVAKPSEGLLLEFEVNRHCVFNTYGFTALLTGLPFRHGLDDTYRLFVEGSVTTRTNDLNVHDRTVLVDNELADYTSLNTIFLCNNGVLNVLREELEEFCLSTGELRHLSHRFIHFSLIFSRKRLYC
jgi:hypothetical protein